MPRGGRREGSGRKRGLASIEAEKARDFLVAKVAKELTPILEAQIEAAKGLYYEEVFKDGTKIIWRKEPDINASKYLLDQTIGRAKESVDVTTLGDKVFETKGLDVEELARRMASELKKKKT